MSLTNILTRTLRGAVVGLVLLTEQGCATLSLQDPYSCYDGLSLDDQINRYVRDIHRSVKQMKNCSDRNIPVDDNGSHVCYAYVESESGKLEDNKLVQIFIPGNASSQQLTVTILFNYYEIGGEGNYLHQVSFKLGKDRKFDFDGFNRGYFIKPISSDEEKSMVRRVLQDTLFLMSQEKYMSIYK